VNKIGSMGAGIPIELDSQTVTPAVPEVEISKESTAGPEEVVTSFGLDDTDLEMEEKLAQDIDGSRWAHETKEKAEKQVELEEDDEDEEGSQDGTKQRWARDGRKLEDLVLEIATMGSKLEKLKEVPRKKRDAQ